MNADDKGYKPTIIYPEIEALRYLIDEQRKELEKLRKENKLLYELNEYWQSQATLRTIYAEK